MMRAHVLGAAVVTVLAGALAAACLDRERPYTPGHDGVVPGDADGVFDQVDAMPDPLGPDRSDETSGPEEIPELGDANAAEPGDAAELADLAELEEPHDLAEAQDLDAQPPDFDAEPHEALDETAEAEVCAPQCEGLACGPDGCGGSCGTCPGPQDLCAEGLCLCIPACGGKECGPDGCGGVCGQCADPQDVCYQGTCLCIPDCEGKECGSGGCGMLCGVCAGPQDACLDGVCVCQPECAGKQCGDDGCSAACGTCDDGKLCTLDSCLGGACVSQLVDFYCLLPEGCVPSGTENPLEPCLKCLPAVSQSKWSPLPDGTPCGPGSVCFAGACCPHDLHCAGLACGPDGCGADCGQCDGPLESCQEGMCVCTPDCNGKSCGPDGCGGDCGECPPGQTCADGKCACSAKDHTDCCLEGVCWFDSCGNQEEVVASCPFGCLAGTCQNCVPLCEGKACGPDGCGSACGYCTGPQQICKDGTCACQPACEGKACGSDGCGATCGTCAGAQDKCLSGNCVCQPACSGKQCGPDGCGNACGSCLGAQDACTGGLCVCQPKCAGKTCGSDGCGGSCGSCDTGLPCSVGTCIAGACSSSVLPGTCLFQGQCFIEGMANPANSCQRCYPSKSQVSFSAVPDGTACGIGGVCVAGSCCDAAGHCNGKSCGTDGCGGTCGTCPGPQDVCSNGLCLCIPACAGKTCGPDGCAATCGSCAAGKTCSNGQCVCKTHDHPGCCGGNVCWFDGCGNQEDLAQTCTLGCANGACVNCTPDCAGKKCGPDGCGGACGTCPGLQDACVNGLCVCQPACIGKTCGSDGCTGSCGTCPGPQDVCFNSQCLCQPACAGKKCGPDGCGSACGTCTGPQEACVSGLCVCQPACLGKVCGPDGCGGACGSCDDLLACTNDTCNAGACVHSIVELQCLISGTCFASGAPDPTNACRVCNPSVHSDAWTTLSEGTACGPGKVCFAAACCDKTAQCAGKECGDDGCGATCGTCAPGLVCKLGLCKDPQQCDDGNLLPWDGCTAGYISEFLCNAYTTWDQQSPAAAVLDDQHFLVAWQSNGQDGDNLGIYARVFTPGVAPTAADLLVNSTTVKAQQAPRAAALSPALAVIVWESDGQDGDGLGIVGRLVAADGKTAGTEFKANAWTAGSQAHPAAAVSDPGKEFVVVWSGPSASDASGIAARRFSYACAPKNPQEFLVNSPPDGDQVEPAVATLSAGFVVVWQSDGRDAQGDAIMARMFKPDGTPSGNELLVNSYQSGDQLAPDVVALPDGGFLAAWSGKGDGDTAGVFARRFDAAGQPASPEFRLNSTVSGKQESPALALGKDGGIVAAWTSNAQDTSADGIVLRRFTAAGSPVSAEVVANSFVTGTQLRPAIASFSDATVILAWDSPNQDGDKLGVFAVRFHPDGYRLYR